MVELNSRVSRRTFGALSIGAAVMASSLKLAAAQDASPVASPMVNASQLANLDLPAFDVVATEYTYSAKIPGALAEGWYVFNLINESETVASVNFAMLPEDARAGDLSSYVNQMLNGTATEEPAWLANTQFAGGTIVDPGMTASGVVYFVPGTWTLFSSHKNSVQSPASIKIQTPEELEVNYGIVAEGTPAASPVADAGVADPAGLVAGMTVDVADDAITASAPPAAGLQVIKVTNSGSMPQDLVVLHTPDMLDETGAASLVQSFVAGEEVNAHAFGGVGALSSGVSAFGEVNVIPGTYIAFSSMGNTDGSQVLVFNAQ